MHTVRWFIIFKSLIINNFNNYLYFQLELYIRYTLILKSIYNLISTSL